MFDHLSKSLASKRADIEVASLDLGDQIEAKELTLFGISYDPKSDRISIALEGVDHMINKPREVYADLTGGGVRSLAIIDSDKAMQIVTLHDALMLPPPQSAESHPQKFG